MTGIYYPPGPPKLSICCDPPAPPDPINSGPLAATELVPPILLRPCLGTYALLPI